MPNLRDAFVSLICRTLAIPFARARKPLPAAPRAVLVLKPCCLGDVLMATAVVGQLRKRYPQAKIGFAVGPWSRAAIAGNPDVDALIDCGKVGSGDHFSWRDYQALVGRLRREQFEICYVLDRSPLLTLLPFLAGVPHRVGIDSGGRGFPLTVKTPWKETKHESELYLDALRASGWPPAEPRTRFCPSPEARAWIAGRLGDLTADPAKGRCLVAIHPGGGVNPGMTMEAKRWFPDRFAALGQRLIDQGHAVVLVGAPSDLTVARLVVASLDEATRHDPRLIDLTGQTSFDQLGALLERCQLFVGNDSGPSHLAMAVGAPVLTIFGPTSPQMYGPAAGHGTAIYKPVDCSPCFVAGRYNRRCREFQCLQGITVEDVWREAERLLRTSGEEQDAVQKSDASLPA